MFDTFRKLYEILTPAERKRAVLVFFMMLVVAMLETAGVASILPFISVLANPELITSNALLSVLYEFSGAGSVSEFSIMLGIGFLTILLLSLAAKALSQWLQLDFTKMRVHSIGYRLMSGYLAQPYEWFLQKHTSRLTTSILSEVNRVISASLYPALQMIAHGIVVVFILLFLLIIDPKVALIAGGTLGIAYGLVYIIVRKPLGRFGRWRYEANLKRFKITQDTFGGIKDVLIGGLEARMLEKFEKPSYQTAKQDVKVDIIKQIPGFFMQALVFGGFVTVLLYLSGVYGSMMNALPIFGAFAFAGYRLMPSLQQIYSHMTSLRASSANLNGLIRDLRELPHRPNCRETEDVIDELPGVSKQIELRRIEYRYPGSNELALASVDIVIPAHKQVGLVGATGSGKSTTVDLILGLLRPLSGELLVDGQEITRSNMRAWQQCIGYVPQQIFLTDDTVASNIAFGLLPEERDMDAVIKAAKIANLHEFVMNQMPEGYDTAVGERGVRLSGGQRQRIGIARALYRDPDVIVLDEATSALDNLTEKAVMEAVDNLSGKKTIIMIAHRLSTVQNCDVIYLMSRGSVKSCGSFEDLVASSDEFRAMSGR